MPGGTLAVYGLLDVLFVVFHTAVGLFVLTGWIWRRTRRLHLVVVGLVMLSWFGLGAFYGLGYCPCTDWHWEVKRELGERDLPYSYVKYYADRVTGSDWDATLVDRVVTVLGLGALTASVWANARRGPGRDRRSSVPPADREGHRDPC